MLTLIWIFSGDINEYFKFPEHLLILSASVVQIFLNLLLFNRRLFQNPNIPQ